jgi:hypothetical protein
LEADLGPIDVLGYNVGITTPEKVPVDRPAGVAWRAVLDVDRLRRVQSSPRLEVASASLRDRRWCDQRDPPHRPGSVCGVGTNSGLLSRDRPARILRKL